MALSRGDPVPWFTVRSTTNPQFKFDTVAGRYIVLSFIGSATGVTGRRILDDVMQFRQRYDDVDCCFFGVSIDPQDELLGRLRDDLPGVRFFWDFDRKVSEQFGAVAAGSLASPSVEYRAFTLLFDTRLRVLDTIPSDGLHAQRLATAMNALGTADPPVAGAGLAPVLVVPRIFEPEFCRKLIDLYEQSGGEDSGFMRDVEGKSMIKFDYGHKRRRDYNIEEEEIRKAAMFCIHRRLIPEIRKAFQFHATRMERYIVACYEPPTADIPEGGHFRPHRDNTTKGTAHRRFAVSLNLNTGEYTGGELRFPEFGRQTYSPPAGGAIVFSCSLLHEATPILSGKRYVFLPFLYDDEAAKIRAANNVFLGEGVPKYQP
ncbi:MAG: 2OG-Fe(II) oxygenase [Pirellulales bacterium]